MGRPGPVDVAPARGRPGTWSRASFGQPGVPRALDGRRGLPAGGSGPSNASRPTSTSARQPHAHSQRGLPEIGVSSTAQTRSPARKRAGGGRPRIDAVVPVIRLGQLDGRSSRASSAHMYTAGRATCFQRRQQPGRLRPCYCPILRPGGSSTSSPPVISPCWASYWST